MGSIHIIWPWICSNWDKNCCLYLHCIGYRQAMHVGVCNIRALHWISNPRAQARLTFFVFFFSRQFLFLSFFSFFFYEFILVVAFVFLFCIFYFYLKITAIFLHKDSLYKVHNIVLGWKRLHHTRWYHLSYIFRAIQKSRKYIVCKQ